MSRLFRSKSIDIIPEIDIEGQTEKECPKKYKINRKQSNFVKEYVREYASNSNLHGIKYLGEIERTLPEKREIFEDIVMVCPAQITDNTGRKTCNGNSTVINLVDVAPEMSEIFVACEWNNTLYDNCKDLFSPILTEEGICFTFNMLRGEELFKTENVQKNYQYMFLQNKSQSWNQHESQPWTLENGYTLMAPIETYPYRGVGYGAEAALAVTMLNKRTDLDYICGGPMQGSKILLHNPTQLPRPKQQYFRVPLTQEVVVAVKPKIMTTSEGLRHYSAERRHCYFTNERYLRYFKLYTQANCEFECLTNYTNARCGCVHVGMPHDGDMKTCSIGLSHCVIQARKYLVAVAIESALNKKRPSLPSHESNNEARHVATQCNCLPACISIDYEAETSQDNFDWEAFFAAYNLTSEYDNDKTLSFSRVMIFFKDQEFIKTRRSELYNQTDFLANCGGLLGLFMGFSLLSVVEIIYFLTLRLFGMIWTRKANKKKN